MITQVLKFYFSASDIMEANHSLEEKAEGRLWFLVSNKIGRSFQVMWPSQNIWTLHGHSTFLRSNISKRGLIWRRSFFWLLSNLFLTFASAQLNSCQHVKKTRMKSRQNFWQIKNSENNWTVKASDRLNLQSGQIWGPRSF